MADADDTAPAASASMSAAAPPDSNACDEYDAALIELRTSKKDLADAEKNYRDAKAKMEAAQSAHTSADTKSQKLAEQHVDALLARPTAWNELYRRLKAFKEERGHCNARRNARNNKKMYDVSAEERAVGVFVYANRCDHRRPDNDPDKLEWYKRIALDRLGFEWDLYEARFNKHFAELEAFKNLHGHCSVPQNKEPYVALRQWTSKLRMVYNARKRKKKCALSLKNPNFERFLDDPEKMERLNRLGFVWNMREQARKAREQEREEKELVEKWEREEKEKAREQLREEWKREKEIQKEVERRVYQIIRKRKEREGQISANSTEQSSKVPTGSGQKYSESTNKRKGRPSSDSAAKPTSKKLKPEKDGISSTISTVDVANKMVGPSMRARYVPPPPPPPPRPGQTSVPTGKYSAPSSNIMAGKPSPPLPPTYPYFYPYSPYPPPPPPPPPLPHPYFPRPPGPASLPWMRATPAAKAQAAPGRATKNRSSSSSRTSVNTRTVSTTSTVGTSDRISKSAKSSNTSDHISKSTTKSSSKGGD